MDYPRHGLKGEMKRRVFDALLEQQQGKCFICWISQAEIVARGRERLKERMAAYEDLGVPVNERALSNTTHCTLHIDHCHITGMIRGLLCDHCNFMLSEIENYGVGVEDDYQPPNIDAWDEDHYERMIEGARSFLDRYRTIILLYMQRERWFPRKDILAHLQART